MNERQHNHPLDELHRVKDDLAQQFTSAAAYCEHLRYRQRKSATRVKPFLQPHAPRSR